MTNNTQTEEKPAYYDAANAAFRTFQTKLNEISVEFAKECEAGDVSFIEATSAFIDVLRRRADHLEEKLMEVAIKSMFGHEPTPANAPKEGQ